jgi:hypothetical protein
VGVINAHADEGRKNVLDGVNANRAFSEGRSVRQSALRDVGIDERLVGKVDATESAVSFGAGFKATFLRCGGRFRGRLRKPVRVLHVRHGRGVLNWDWRLLIYTGVS